MGLTTPVQTALWMLASDWAQKKSFLLFCPIGGQQVCVL